MERIIYYVIFDRGEWQIECNGIKYGPHKSREIAVRLAIAAAELAKRDGDAARVIVQGSENSWHVEFQHGFEDYFPSFA